MVNENIVANGKKNFKLVIEYDGTSYHGWQRQKSDRTIQGEIEKALSFMTEQSIVLIGSGRTDAGVHAKGQVANFLCNSHLTPDIFQKGLNSLLPKDIVIKNALRLMRHFMPAIMQNIKNTNTGFWTRTFQTQSAGSMSGIYEKNLILSPCS